MLANRGGTGMESLEWRILDRVSSRNFILGGGGGKLTDHVAVRPWRGEGRPYNKHILGGKLGQFFCFFGGGGGGGELLGGGGGGG